LRLRVSSYWDILLPFRDIHPSTCRRARLARTAALQFQVPSWTGRRRTVADLVAGSELQFEDSGEYELKGILGAWKLYAVKDPPGSERLAGADRVQESVEAFARAVSLSTVFLGIPERGIVGRGQG